MASLYKRTRDGEVCSPFWWIKYRDAAGNIRRECTGFRHDNGPDNRRAAELEAERTLAERRSTTFHKKELWESWVTEFISERYDDKPSSKLRYATAWRTIRMFLEEQEITVPRQLTYQHCLDYLKWRKLPDKESGKYAAGHNTAVLELKFLALVMRHAVRCGYAQGNPCRELGLSRKRAKLFPDYTDADIQTIVDGIHREPAEKRAYLWPSFLVAYYHGVRLSETNVHPMRAVTLLPPSPAGRVGSITFHQKGGKVRVKPLHPELLAMFTELQARRATETFPQPKSFAKEWHNFLHRCGLKATKPDACFHSLRVTVQNRLRRAGVPKEIRKAYLSHDGRDDVNELYDRIDDGPDVDEMLVCHAPLNRTWQIKPELRNGK